MDSLVLKYLVWTLLAYGLHALFAFTQILLCAYLIVDGALLLSAKDKLGKWPGRLGLTLHPELRKIPWMGLVMIVAGSGLVIPFLVGASYWIVVVASCVAFALLLFLAQKLEDLRLGYQMFFKYRQALSVPLGKVDQSIMNDLSVPVVEWMEKSGFKGFHGGDFPLMRSFGFGYECQNVPAIYSFQIMMLMAHGGNLLTLLDRSKFSLDRVVECYGELFRRIAEPLDVELGVQIESVNRDGKTVIVKSNRGEREFDHIILACDPKDALEFLDATGDEQELFAGLSHIPVWQARFRASGIDKSLIVESRQVFEKLGYGMAFLKYDPESDWIYYFGYISDNVKEPELSETMKADIADIADIADFGGEMLTEPVMQWWPKYYPHYDNHQVKDGFHARLEGLQGQNNTFLTGAALANNGIEWVINHAKNLVEQHFE